LIRVKKKSRIAWGIACVQKKSGETQVMAGGRGDSSKKYDQNLAKLDLHIVFSY
jgi:hypothetical protein